MLPSKTIYHLVSSLAVGSSAVIGITYSFSGSKGMVSGKSSSRFATLLKSPSVLVGTMYNNSQDNSFDLSGGSGQASETDAAEMLDMLEGTDVEDIQEEAKTITEFQELQQQMKEEEDIVKNGELEVGDEDPDTQDTSDDVETGVKQSEDNPSSDSSNVEPDDTLLSENSQNNNQTNQPNETTEKENSESSAGEKADNLPIDNSPVEQKEEKPDITLTEPKTEEISTSDQTTIPPIPNFDSNQQLIDPEKTDKESNSQASPLPTEETDNQQQPKDNIGVEGEHDGSKPENNIDTNITDESPSVSGKDKTNDQPQSPKPTQKPPEDRNDNENKEMSQHKNAESQESDGTHSEHLDKTSRVGEKGEKETDTHATDVSDTSSTEDQPSPEQTFTNESTTDSQTDQSDKTEEKGDNNPKTNKVPEEQKEISTSDQKSETPNSNSDKDKPPTGQEATSDKKTTPEPSVSSDKLPSEDKTTHDQKNTTKDSESTISPSEGSMELPVPSTKNSLEEQITQLSGLTLDNISNLFPDHQDVMKNLIKAFQAQTSSSQKPR